ncbi:hypothetical protein DAEQUDRAFT_207329 [Daedalea quercina L-15889]|uniref:Uncharacterized protein n=1 Tax=Daedalea quercina L-15889 TaxID=1314783 RepID=A0A165R959_9APHY|nr:hypothetical protein DAEQUDRAFT_207329 [Daedalea quercina L-15889]
MGLSLTTPSAGFRSGEPPHFIRYPQTHKVSRGRGPAGRRSPGREQWRPSDSVWPWAAWLMVSLCVLAPMICIGECLIW